MFVYWEFVKLFPVLDWLVSQYWYQCVCTIDLADSFKFWTNQIAKSEAVGVKQLCVSEPKDRV